MTLISDLQQLPVIQSSRDFIDAVFQLLSVTVTQCFSDSGRLEA